MVTLIVLLLSAGSCTAAQDQAGEPLPPEIDFDRWSRGMVDCLRGKGFDARAAAGGAGYDVQYPDEQRSAFVVAVEECTVEMEQSGVSVDVSPLTDGQLRTLFDLLVTQAECLEREGYSTRPPPSVDAFVDSGGQVWNPFDEFDTIKEAQWLDLQTKCPLR